MTTNAPRELFRLARQRADIASLSGVPAGKRGACPLCNRPTKGDTAFQHNRNGRFKCWRCDARGDGIDLYAAVHGIAFKAAAAREILGLPVDGSDDAKVRASGLRAERKKPAAAPREPTATKRALAYRHRIITNLDNGSRPAFGARRVEYWLEEVRGLPTDLIRDALQRLRSVSQAHYWEDFERGGVVEHPAMVGVIENAAGDIIGRHCTYLARNGAAKAAVEAPRKIWGSSRGGIWLTERDPWRGPLFVAEGVETALSMLVRWRKENQRDSGRALAVLSLGNLQGGWARDRLGRVDLFHPQPDPAVPAVTWPDMGEVVIGADHDMSRLRLKVRASASKTDLQSIDPTVRMRVCGSLATYWWRKARARDVKVAYPPVGMDCNDALLQDVSWKLVRHAHARSTGPS